MKKLLLFVLLFSSSLAFAQIAQVTSGSQALSTVLLDADPTITELDLVSFEAQAQGTEGVLVRWTTASERPDERFILERTADLMNWEILLEAPGDGGPSEITHYEALDKKPFAGVSYYRLVQENEGRYEELSDLYSVRFDPLNDLLIQGDHTPGRFTVQAQGPITELLLLNNRGQFIPMQLEYDGDMVRVNAELLASGTYYVQAIVAGSNILRPIIIDQGFVVGG